MGTYEDDKREALAERILFLTEYKTFLTNEKEENE